MKKILIGLIFAGLILGLMAPMAFAQFEKPNDCCALRHTIKIGNNSANDGSIVAAPTTQNPWCDLDRDGRQDTISAHFDNWGMFCLLDSVMTITDWIFYILLLVSVVMIVIGAFSFMTAAGNPEKAGKAKSLIIYAVVGLVIALIAKMVPSIVRFIIGM